MTITPVLFAATRWPDNATMIRDVARLGYLREEWLTLDVTYGLGNWWKHFRPTALIGHDLKTDGVDFTALPEPDNFAKVVAFDPPYKLNGRPDPLVDERYGVAGRASWQRRHALIRDGIAECARVLQVKGVLLVKCQDQVCGGKIRWQTREFADCAESHGLRLEDSALMLGGRSQPDDGNEDGRKQEHIRRNYSTLLIFTKPRARAA